MSLPNQLPRTTQPGRPSVDRRSDLSLVTATFRPTSRQLERKYTGFNNSFTVDFSSERQKKQELDLESNVLPH